MDTTAFKEWAARQSWRYAKTMPDKPHEYTLREFGKHTEWFEALSCIMANGTMRIFQNRPYTYLDIEGVSYWAMGTQVINRTSDSIQAMHARKS